MIQNDQNIDSMDFTSRLRNESYFLFHFLICVLDDDEERKTIQYSLTDVYVYASISLSLCVCVRACVFVRMLSEEREKNMYVRFYTVL